MGPRRPILPLLPRPAIRHSLSRSFNMTPRLSQGDVRQTLRTNIIAFTERFLRRSSPQHSTNVFHIILRELRVAIQAPFRGAAQANIIRVSHILRPCTPLQIINSIVELVSIFMVHVFQWIEPRNKGLGYKPMHQMKRHLPLDFESYLKVSTAIYTLPQPSTIMRPLSFFRMRPYLPIFSDGV